VVYVLLSLLLVSGDSEEERAFPRPKLCAGDRVV